MKKKFDIEGMTCASCQASVEKSVKKLGVDQVNVSLLTNTMDIDTDLSDDEIVEAVEKAGYKAIPRNTINNKKSKKKNPKEIFDKQIKDLKFRLIISVPLMLILMYVAMGHMIGLPTLNVLEGHSGAGNFALVQFLLTLPILYVNRNYFRDGFKSLLNRNPNMDSLVAIGSGAAIVYGIFAMFMINHGLGINKHEMVMHYMHDLYFEAGAMILTLITLGKFLEVRSKSKTTESINKLMDLTPDTVTLVDNGIEKVVGVDEVNVEDLIKVKPGERIAIDGVIVEGQSSIDTSAVTGESLPIDVKVGDRVISGSVNNTGSFIIKATSVGENTTISQIVKLMEEASATKAPISKLADKISSIFVPTVIIISIISFIVWIALGYSFTFAFSIAIGILVISCPCALGLATPVSMMVANGKAAEHGILVKNAESLEILHKIDAIVLDKTGTITKGETILTDIASRDGMEVDFALKLASSLEQNSQHPLAKAIIEFTNSKNIQNINVDDFDSITGKGIKGIIEGKTYYIGNDKLIKDVGADFVEAKKLADKYSSQGKTSVYLFDEDSILAIFAIADSIKSTSKDAVQKINSFGIDTIMLTGDNEKTAKEIANQVGISDYRAELLPQDKDKLVQDLQDKGKLVAMVGDGINDAPSLMRADVGIAIGAGTDIAIESADLVLIKSNLMDIVSSIELSKATIKNIKQNLFWAFFYNVISIPLAMGLFYTSFGIRLNPMVGALAMSLSSVFVVTNALRLNRFKIDNVSEKNDIDKNIEVNYDKIKISEIENSREDNNMAKKVINIEGMSCMHCKSSVEKALTKFSQDVEVLLDEKQAIVKVDKSVSDQDLIDAVTEAGYEVVSIS